MFEKIKIKATLASGKPWRSGGNNIISVLTTFISDGLTKDEVDRLQAILKVIETGDQSLEKLVLNNVYLQPAVQPTPISNAVLAERIVELDRRLSQYMEVGKSHVESINGLIEEVTRLRTENASLVQRNDSLRATNEDSTNVIVNFRRNTLQLEDKITNLKEVNELLNEQISAKEKDLFTSADTISGLQDIINNYEDIVHTLEQQIELQIPHAASLENQVADKIQELEIQSKNVAILNRRYVGVCEALDQYRNAWTHLASQKIGVREYTQAFNNLDALFKLFPVDLMPQPTKVNSEAQEGY